MSNWLIEQAEYRTTKNGKQYLWAQGNTGEKRKPMYIWNSPMTQDPSKYKGLVFSLTQEKDMGDYISASWNDMVILNLDELEPCALHKIKLKGDVNSNRLINILNGVIAIVSMPKFFKDFLASEEVVEILMKYQTRPAGAKVHHPWENGLSTHTAEALEAYAALANVRYLKGLKHHVAIVAIVFHDYGKLLEYKKDGEYTKVMPLLGHIYIGASEVERLLVSFYHQNIEKYTDYPISDLYEDVVRIQHAILAHHGEKEAGSPVVPATIEAYMVHLCDLISARANMWDMAVDMERNPWLGTFVVKD